MEPLSRLTIKSLLSCSVRWRNILLWDFVFTRETHDCIYRGGNYKSSIQTSSLLHRGSAHANGSLVISSGRCFFGSGLSAPGQTSIISVTRTGFRLKSGAIKLLPSRKCLIQRCFHVHVTVLCSVHCGPSERSVTAALSSGDHQTKSILGTLNSPRRLRLIITSQEALFQLQSNTSPLKKKKKDVRKVTETEGHDGAEPSISDPVMSSTHWEQTRWTPAARNFLWRASPSDAFKQNRSTTCNLCI